MQRPQLDISSAQKTRDCVASDVYVAVKNTSKTLHPDAQKKVGKQLEFNLSDGSAETTRTRTHNNVNPAHDYGEFGCFNFAGRILQRPKNSFQYRDSFKIAPVDSPATPKVFRYSYRRKDLTEYEKCQQDKFFKC